jgi:hypothetical protein
MKIVVDDKGFDIDGHRLIYDLYYFDSEQYDAPTLGFSIELTICSNLFGLLRISCILILV